MERWEIPTGKLDCLGNQIWPTVSFHLDHLSVFQNGLHLPQHQPIGWKMKDLVFSSDLTFYFSLSTFHISPLLVSSCYSILNLFVKIFFVFQPCCRLPCSKPQDNDTLARLLSFSSIWILDQSSNNFWTIPHINFVPILLTLSSISINLAFFTWILNWPLSILSILPQFPRSRFLPTGIMSSSTGMIDLDNNPDNHNFVLNRIDPSKQLEANGVTFSHSQPSTEWAQVCLTGKSNSRW